MDEIGFPKNLPNEFKPYFAAAHNEIVYLKEKINALNRINLAQRSERYIPEELILPQGSLFNEPEQIVHDDCKADNSPSKPNEKPEEKGKNPRAPREKGGKKTFPESIPRETKIHDLSQDEKICKNDLTPLVIIGEDIVEKLDVIPTSLKVIQHRYLKYACPCCEQNVLKAKAELSIIPGSMAEPGLLAHIVTNKFLFALPLYRQELLFKTKEIEIPRVTLARWMIAVGNSILPLVEEIKNYILSQEVIHCDETTVQVLRGTGKEPTSKNYMWVLASGLDSHPAVVFQYYSSRSQECAHDFLEEFRGHLHVDGYDGYNSFCNLNNITRIACWAHVRRKFESAFKDGAIVGKSLSEEFLKEIKNLFLIEREVIQLTPDERVKIRKQKSQISILAIRKLIDDNVTKIVPRSKLGSAFGYISNEWPHLLHFLNHGLISLSNNRVENFIRPFAVGRKNWLFSNSVDGAVASAALYSLIGSAKENNLHVEEYLVDVFTQLPCLLQQENPSFYSLLPWNWKKDFLSDKPPNIDST